MDDLFGTSGNEMEQRVLTRHRNDLQIGSEDWNDVAFIVSQDKAIDELEEVPVNEIRRNTSIALLQCTQFTEAYWDR